MDQKRLFDGSDTAIVFTDPQNEVLSDEGGAWALVRESVNRNKTIENMEGIFRAAKQNGYAVFISPHYYYPTDDAWQFRDPSERSCTKERCSRAAAHSASTGFRDRAPIGWIVSSPTLRTARQSLSVHIKFMDPSPTT
jgi:nicotinamidase-related amidase